VQKQWERTQEVFENKEHHFFEWCRFGVFCAQISTNYALKGARPAHSAQNEARLTS
jgi:hypothetical protein